MFQVVSRHFAGSTLHYDIMNTTPDSSSGPNMQNLNGGPPRSPDILNQDLNSFPLPEAAQDAECLLQCIPARHSDGFLNQSEVVAWKEQMEAVSVSFPIIFSLHIFQFTIFASGTPQPRHEEAKGS